MTKQIKLKAQQRDESSIILVYSVASLVCGPPWAGHDSILRAWFIQTCPAVCSALCCVQFVSVHEHPLSQADNGDDAGLVARANMPRAKRTAIAAMGF